ncbi:hypothetical protein [Actinospica sp.]|uniref:hypothetical protein n=1 Tax=Actinospica sp. TaxID=1872142 RepID=UPI002C8C68C5|nr:hypothetical protein [Actinospica sp.]HWG24321.1 hypothetical protein [Actinospica sp.]
MRILEIALGSFIVLFTWISVVANLVVPRGLRSRYTRFIRDAVRAPFQLVADRCRTFERKDLLLAWSAPLSILVTLLSWLGLSVVGFGFVLAGVGDINPGKGMLESGSSVFTLGFLSSSDSQQTFVDFCAAATGPVMIGLLVGYLPAMYSAYSQREAEVTMLQARAGVPAWGPEILMRHVQVPGLITQLTTLYQGWERWAAQIAESHTSYPVLIHFRSPRATRNWLIALLAIMDAAALELALNPSKPKATMRMTLRAGFTCLREIADVEGIPYEIDPDPDSEIQLTYAEFLRGLDMLRYAGYPMEREHELEEAWAHFRGWRVNYESLAYTLAYRIDAVAAPWSGPRRTQRQTFDPRSPVDRQPRRFSPESGSAAETDSKSDSTSPTR